VFWFLLTACFEVVQYTHLFGGHACLYRSLLPDDKTYYDAINVYGREALRTQEKRRGIVLMTFEKGGNGGGDAFHNSIVGSSWFIKVDLKEIYCSY